MSQLVKEYLEKKKITQRVLAREIGCTTAFLNGLVHGKNTDIKISLLKRLHKKTNISMQRLVEDLLSCKNK